MAGAVVRADAAPIPPEALVGVVRQQTSVGAHGLVVERLEHQVHAVGGGCSDPPRREVLTEFVLPVELFVDLGEPPVHAQGVLGHGSALGPLATELQADDVIAATS